MQAEVELYDFETVASICNTCGKEDMDVDDCKFCHRCMQVAFCSSECAKKSWDEHQTTCKPISAETFQTLIGPPMRGGGGGGGRGSFRPGGGGRPARFTPGASRPRVRPAGGFRPYRSPGRYPGRYGGGSRYFSRSRVPWQLGFYNPFWYDAYSLWYPRYWTPQFAYSGRLPVLPAILDIANQAAINAQLMALRADPRYAVPGAQIVPDPVTGGFIYVGVA